MPRKSKIGIALGAGGARGMAHIGVLRILQSNHIPIEMIAGTSSGAVIGAMFAATKDPDWIQNRVRRFINSKAYKSVGLDQLKITEQPNASIFQSAASYMKKKIIVNMANDRLGLLKQERLREVIDFMLPVKTFESLMIPFSCTTIDLNSGEEIICDSGNLIDALTASSTIPGFFPPIEKDGMLLSDGGISCPIPVQTLTEMGAKFIIAVNVGQKYFEQLNSPNLLQILGRAEQISTSRLGELKLKEVEFPIEPDTKGIYWAAFDRLDEIVLRGEEETQKQFMTLKRILMKKSGIRYRLKEMFN